ncbi:hypothetical protein XH94_35430, partial [Bradyrhizobium zhanjiangense]
IGHWSLAGPISTGRDLLSERLVWPFEVVDFPPGVEGTLRLCEIAELSQCEHLSREGAVESFILAAALRVIWAAADDGDAKLEQPHREPCPSLAGRITPGRTIVDEEGLREPVVAKGLLQAAAHGICALIGTGLQTQIIAGVVIHHRQRMALGIIAEP